MANDPTDRPKPPVLKRFANLEFDGDEPKPRPKPARKAPAPPRDAAQAARSDRPSRPDRPEPGPTVAPRPTPTPPRRDPALEPPRGSLRSDPDGIDELVRMADELTDLARSARQAASPNARREERAAELRRMRPPDPPRPRPQREPTPAEAAARREELARREVDRLRFDLREVRPADLDLDLPDARMMATPGVMTMEVDLRRRAPPMPAPRMAAPQRQAPIDVTPMAARQIQLMAWEAGVPGSGLRILTSRSPGMARPELDFAFDDHIEPDDHVFEVLGVTLIIDPATLPWVRGRRITWLDVPGSEGFQVR